MMINLRRISLVCVSVLICLALCSCASSGAKSCASKCDVAPSTKSQTENTLTALGGEIVRKAPMDDKSAFALLKSHLDRNPDIYGAAFAFAPVMEKGSPVKSSPYVFRSEGKLIEKNLANSYDYTVQEWYAQPAKTGKPVWSKPYFDEGGGDAWMITYSIPIFSQDNQTQIIGVITSDLLIPNK